MTYSPIYQAIISKSRTLLLPLPHTFTSSLPHSSLLSPGPVLAISSHYHSHRDDMSLSDDESESVAEELEESLAESLAEEEEDYSEDHYSDDLDLFPEQEPATATVSPLLSSAINLDDLVVSPLPLKTKRVDTRTTTVSPSMRTRARIAPLTVRISTCPRCPCRATLLPRRLQVSGWRRDPPSSKQSHSSNLPMSSLPLPLLQLIWQLPTRPL